MEPVIGGPKFSLEILFVARVLDPQEMNAFWNIMWVGE